MRIKGDHPWKHWCSTKCFICLLSTCLLLVVILRSNSSKSKAETPRTPSSPSSPTFTPSVCLLAPCYLTGDSVRDKCVEMLSAALKADGERAWTSGRGGKGSPRSGRGGFSPHHESGTRCWSPLYKQASLPRSSSTDAYVSRISFRWLQGLWSQLWQDGIRNWRSYPWAVPGLWVPKLSSSRCPKCKGSRTVSGLGCLEAVPHFMWRAISQGRFPHFTGEVNWGSEQVSPCQRPSANSTGIIKIWTQQVWLYNLKVGTSLNIQWLGLHAFTARGLGSIPYRGTKIMQAVTARKTAKNKKNPRAQGSERLCLDRSGLWHHRGGETQREDSIPHVQPSLSSSSEDNNSHLWPPKYQALCLGQSTLPTSVDCREKYQ